MIDRDGEQRRAETLAVIQTENLSGYRWFEDATNDTDIVAIQRTETGWLVFATDERATPQGRREFRSSNSVEWREKARRENTPRYFVRELRVDGRLVPARLFRRRETDHGPVDEMLVDVDTWHPDTKGMLERVIRFPLDSDLEEISDAAASEVFAMVARREYTPLTRR